MSNPIHTAYRYEQEEAPAISGLKTTRVTGIQPFEDGTERRTVTLRSETMVVDVNDDRMRGRRLSGKAFLWRSETVASDWDHPTAGRVSYDGFMASGQQALHYTDADVARYVKTRRNADGTIHRAEDDPDFARASERYAQMMSY